MAQQGHGDRRTGLGGEKSRCQGDVADVAAREIETGELAVIQCFDRRLRWEHAAPDGFALGGIGEREVHHEAQPTAEGRVQRALVVGGQDRQPAISLHALEQVAHLDIGVTVVAVLHVAALAEQGIRFVEEQDGAAVLGGVEDLYNSKYGTQNAAGTASASSLQIDVNGLTVKRAPFFPAATMLVGSSQAAKYSESGPQLATEEDVSKLGRQVAVWGMYEDAEVYFPAGLRVYKPAP